jgi:hypothetical protein
MCRRHTLHLLSSFPVMAWLENRAAENAQVAHLASLKQPPCDSIALLCKARRYVIIACSSAMGYGLCICPLRRKGGASVGICVACINSDQVSSQHGIYCIMQLPCSHPSCAVLHYKRLSFTPNTHARTHARTHTHTYNNTYTYTHKRTTHTCTPHRQASPWPVSPLPCCSTSTTA